jgi:hypothetical protein
VGVKISVVICAHSADRWGELASGVASVTDQSHPPHEVIVSIDHDDELLERARQAFPHARVVAN